MSLNGWIIYNGHLRGNKFLDFAEWLQEAGNSIGVSTTIYKNNELLSYFGGNHIQLIGQENLPDFVIFTDKDIYLARQLEMLGIRVFNQSKTIDISDDKIATYQVLAQHQLPIPRTIVAPKIFPNSLEIDNQIIDFATNTLGFPMIIKEAFGSFGEQVYLVKNQEELLEKVREIQARPFVFQEFIAPSYGRDLRLHVVGDHVVAAMKRVAVNDFRANVTAGGTMQAYTPTPLEKDIAVAAAKAIGADFAGVDLLFGKENTPIICEINSNAHIRNMYNCTNINVADYIVEYVLQTIKEVIE